MPKGKKGGKKPVEHEEEIEASDEENEQDMAGLQERIQASIARQVNPNYAEEFVVGLPAEVQTRVRALQGMQERINEILEQQSQESKALLKKYETLDTPIFDRRAKIVNGEEEVDVKSAVAHIEEEERATVEEELKKSLDGATKEQKDVKGIPSFWYKVVSNHMLVEDMCQERDVPALEHLKDIKCKRFEDPEAGFTLEFHFGENPFFTNPVLTKTYHLIEADGDVMLERAQGCEIDWKGENLTMVEKKKKQRHKTGKGTRTVTVQEPCDSFFNFFKPPQANEDDEDDEVDEIENLIEADYELGQVFRDQIIPSAVDWFTGKARATQEAEFDFTGDSDEEEEEEDEEEEEEEAPRGRGRGGYGTGRGGRGGAGAGGRGGRGGRGGGQEECKQQ